MESWDRCQEGLRVVGVEEGWAAEGGMIGEGNAAALRIEGG